MIALLWASAPGCATVRTGYHRVTRTGGYVDNHLQDDIHQVTFVGNGYTSESTAADFALLRAAEVSLEEGCPYFTVIENSNHTRSSTHSTPMATHSIADSTLVSGGSIYTVTKPSFKMLIRVLKSRPSDERSLVYDAKQIQQNLRKKYDIKPPE